MRQLFSLGCTLLLFSLAASAAVVRGTLLNDDEPYIVRGEDDSLYKVEWYGGSSLFWEGDEVILTNNFGWGNMIDDDNVARVWVEEISPGYPRIMPRPPPIPMPSPTPKARPAPTPIPSPIPEATPPESSGLSKFVKDFIESGNYADPGKESSFYADDHVDYFGKRNVAKAFIVDDIRRYDQRWPRRAYRLSGDPEITVADSGRDIARAVFKFQFTIGNVQQTIWGSGEDVLLIGNAKTDPKVISVKSKILRKHVEPSGR